MSQVQKRSNAKILLFLIAIVAIIAAIGVYANKHHKKIEPKLPQQVKVDGTYLKTPRQIAAFQLTDNTGKMFTNKDLKGHWTMMFFGFTNCGFVCPTTMAALNKMYVELQKEIPVMQMPQVVMVSVDPARDSVAKMNAYVKSFNKHFRGARADMRQTKALEKSLNVVSVKIIPKNGDKQHYTISHSANIMVIDPQGKLRAFLTFPHKGPELAKDFRKIETLASKQLG